MTCRWFDLVDHLFSVIIAPMAGADLREAVRRVVMCVPIGAGPHDGRRLIAVRAPDVVQRENHEEVAEVALHYVERDGGVRVPVERADGVARAAARPSFADRVLREVGQRLRGSRRIDLQIIHGTT